MDVHQKGLARCSCYAARLSHSMFCGCRADPTIAMDIGSTCNVAGVAHVEQELAADLCDLQDGVDEDEDDDVVP